MSRKPSESENLAVQMMLTVFDSADDCRRENNALRSILRKQGLSASAIQSRVKRALKKPDLDETGAQALRRVCEESVRHFQDFDVQEALARLVLKGKPQ